MTEKTDKSGQDRELRASIEAALDRHQIEAKLRESEEKYRRLANLTSDFVYALQVTSGDGLISEWSTDGYTQITGYREDDADQRDLLTRLIHPDDAPIVRRHLETCLSNQQDVIECRIVTKNGEIRWVRNYLEPVWHDEEGRVVRLYGATQDITERKRVEMALQQQKSFLETLIETIPTPIFYKDAQGRYTGCNQSFETFLGRSRDEIIGRSVHDMGPPEIAKRYAEKDEELFREPGRQRYEWKVKSASGQYRDVVFDKASILGAQGRVEGLVGAITDITERKAAEQALRESYTQQVSDLHWLSETALSLLTLSDVDEILDYAGRVLQEKLEDCVVLTLSTTSDKRALHLESIYGLRTSLIKQMVELIGFDPRDRSFDILPRFMKIYRKGQLYRHPGGLIEFAASEVPTMVAKALTRLFNVQDIYTIGLVGGQQMLGNLHIIARRPDLIEQPKLIESFAHQVALALLQARANQALKEGKERLHILHEIDAAILDAQSPEAIANAVLGRLHRLIPCCYASISEIDVSQCRGRDISVAVNGEIQKGITGWYYFSNAGERLFESIRQGRIYQVDDLTVLEALSSVECMMEAEGIRAYVSVPLVARDTPVGALSLASERPHFFHPVHIEILEEIAASLAVAMQQAKLLSQTRQDAETKEMLLHEVNHRVMNNLTMILSLLELEIEQSRPVNDQIDLQAVLWDVHSRIHGITTVHRMLEQSIKASAEKPHSIDAQDSLDIEALASRVIHSVLSASPLQQQVNVIVDAVDHLPRLSAKRATTLALIINELTTNSVKYAFARQESPGRIYLQIDTMKDEESEEDKVSVTFRDDGPGLPDEVLAGERQNVGLWLVRTNVLHTLSGDIAWHNDDGAVVEIQFPIRSQD